MLLHAQGHPGLKIPGRSQVLFYCHGNPGASVKWESSKIITAFRLGAQWHRVTKDKTPHFGLYQSGALSPARL